MEDSPNGLNGGFTQWRFPSMETPLKWRPPSMETLLNGDSPQWRLPSMVTPLNGDSLNGDSPQWRLPSTETPLNGRRRTLLTPTEIHLNIKYGASILNGGFTQWPQWRIHPMEIPLNGDSPQMETPLNGDSPQWRLPSTETPLNGRRRTLLTPTEIHLNIKYGASILGKKKKKVKLQLSM